MALLQRISALQKRHQWLDQMLTQEERHLHPDEIRVVQIKKSKLRVKDELSVLERISGGLAFIAEREVEYRRAAG
jgi:hypothetical protein